MENLLSKSEWEIAERIALGQSKKEVAYDTHRSVYTVETTIKNVYDKLGFNKLSDLVLWYCGIQFQVDKEIADLKRKIIGVGLLLIFIFDLAIIADQDIYRARRTRSRRRQETELITY
ncbi:MAG: LuxR C-terminal-related transcriptional regulator [Paludibacter sp.]|nr:LuxR C-terminal-related transcriptional regulator [Paludibacter sp.]